MPGPEHPPFFVAVHVGAGFHSERKNPAYKAAMRTACKRAADVLMNGGTAEQATVQAIKALEDSPVCNAGIGSNLTEVGCVECDASIMSGDGVFGSIGAAAGIAHPIEAAACLAAESREPMPLGRVRPIFLVGDGARQYALSRGLLAALSAEEARHWNIASDALSAWKRYRVLIEQAANARNNIPFLVGKSRRPDARSNAEVRQAFAKRSNQEQDLDRRRMTRPRLATTSSDLQPEKHFFHGRFSHHPRTVSVPPVMPFESSPHEGVPVMSAASHDRQAWMGRDFTPDCYMGRSSNHATEMKMADGAADADPRLSQWTDEQHAALQRQVYPPTQFAEPGFDSYARYALPPPMHPAWWAYSQRAAQEWWERMRSESPADGPPFPPDAFQLAQMYGFPGAIPPADMGSAWKMPKGMEPAPVFDRAPPGFPQFRPPTEVMGMDAPAQLPREAPWWRYYAARHPTQTAQRLGNMMDGAGDARHVLDHPDWLDAPHAAAPTADYYADRLPPVAHPGAYPYEVSMPHWPTAPQAYPGVAFEHGYVPNSWSRPPSRDPPRPMSNDGEDDGEVVESRHKQQQASPAAGEPTGFAAGRPYLSVPAFMQHHTAAAIACHGDNEVATDGAADDAGCDLVVGSPSGVKAACEQQQADLMARYYGMPPAWGPFQQPLPTGGPRCDAPPIPAGHCWHSNLPPMTPAIYHANLHADHRGGGGPGSLATGDPLRRPHVHPYFSTAPPHARPRAANGTQDAVYKQPPGYSGYMPFGAGRYPMDDSYTKGQLLAHEQLAEHQAAIAKYYSVLLPPQKIWEIRQEHDRQQQQLAAEHRKINAFASKSGDVAAAAAMCAAGSTDQPTAVTERSESPVPPANDDGTSAEAPPEEAAEAEVASDCNEQHCRNSERQSGSQHGTRFGWRPAKAPSEGDDEWGQAMRNPAAQNYPVVVPEDVNTEEVFDTVGAACVDAQGNVAAGVSSGGIAMKMDGRVGDSAVFGCGVWAVNPGDDGKPGVATTTTGVGENIIRTLLAKRCANAIQELPDDCPVDQAISQGIQSGVKVCPPPHDVGVLAVMVDKKDDGEVNVQMTVVHTAASMGVAYYRHTGQEPDGAELGVKMLRQINRMPHGSALDETGICVFGTNTSWKVPVQ